MIEEPDDRLDEGLQEAANAYHAPPPTPSAEMWQQIQAARRAPKVTPIRRNLPWRFPLAAAAILTIGVAIGRISTPSTPPVTPAGPSIGPARGAATGQERSTAAARLLTVDHLSRAESFLTEFRTQPDDARFSTAARSLLTTTRLLLDSNRPLEPVTRQLLEDLELVLVQIATLDPQDRHEDLGFIAEGLAQSHLRSRLRNAIPAGPAIRM